MAATVFILRSVRSEFTGGMVGWLVVLTGMLLLPPLMIMVVMCRKHRRLIRIVPEHGGIVCPQCAMAMIEGDAAEHWTCPKCSRCFSGDDLLQYWVNVAHHPDKAMWWRLNQREPVGVWIRLITAVKKNPWLSVGANCVLWIGMGLILGLGTGSSVLFSLFTFLHMALLMSGFILLGFGKKRRIGDEKHCVACDYPCGPMPAMPERCPECGSRWRGVGGTVTGMLVRRPRFMAAGTVLIVLSVAALFAPVTRGRQFNFLPTGPLITEVIAAPRGFTIDEWKALRSRTLSKDQTLRLATGLIDRRLKQGSLSNEDVLWIDAQIVAGTLPQELVDRYFREMLEISILAPATVKVNESVTLAMSTRYRHYTQPGPLVLFGGYGVGGDLEPKARQDVTIAGASFGRKQQFLKSVSSHGVSPEATYQFNSSGSNTIRISLWVAIAPLTSAGHTITWNADGTPVPPVGTSWIERRDLEHTIEVEP